MKPLSTAILAADQATFAKVLTAAGAHYWDTDAISAHMQHELAAAPPQSKHWRYLSKIQAVFIKVVTVLALVSVADSFLTMNTKEPTLWQIVTPITASLIAGLLIIASECIHFRGPAQWNTYPVKNAKYRSSAQKGWVVLPPIARSLIDNIKTMRPGTQFEVAALEQDKIKLDPVLYAIEADQRIAVLVWNDDGILLPPT